jgi:hypothetical protein
MIEFREAIENIGPSGAWYDTFWVKHYFLEGQYQPNSGLYCISKESEVVEDLQAKRQRVRTPLN